MKYIIFILVMLFFQKNLFSQPFGKYDGALEEITYSIEKVKSKIKFCEKNKISQKIKKEIEKAFKNDSLSFEPSITYISSLFVFNAENEGLKLNYESQDINGIADIILLQVIEKNQGITFRDFKIINKEKLHKIGIFITFDIGDYAQCEIVEIIDNKYYLIKRIKIALTKFVYERKAKEVIGK